MSKAIILAALAIMAATLLFAPYDFVGHVGIVDSERVSGTTYRRVGWKLDQPVHLEYMPTDQHPDDQSVFVRAAELDTAQLGLWWFGLALITGAVLLLTKKQSPKETR